MKIFFLSHYFSPHIGGVEKHVYLLSKELIKMGHEVTIITEKFDQKLKSKEVIEGINLVRFDYPKKKFIGLFYIWRFLLLKRTLLMESDIIHLHDIFIWYLPFRFVYPRTKVYTTIHGFEWGNPFSRVGILQKKFAVKFSSGTIGVGKFLEKYLGVRFTKVIYGAVNTRDSSPTHPLTRVLRMTRKRKNSMVFVGRLSKDTGVLQFLDWLNKQSLPLRGKKYKVEFVGDGEYRHECEKFGVVHGFTNPQKFLKRSEYVVPGGYLACLEAFSYKCKVKVFWNDNLKKDYWQMSPMYKFMTSERRHNSAAVIKNKDVKGAYEWVKGQNWKKLIDEYLDLWEK